MSRGMARVDRSYTALRDAIGMWSACGIVFLSLLVPADSLAEGTRTPQGERRETLYFEVQGQPTRMAFVHARIAGHETSMLLDTGATAHVVASWLVKAEGLATQETTDGASDHEGHHQEWMRRTEDTAIVLESLGSLESKDHLVADVPPIFEQRNIGGIVSPWLLIKPGEALLIDFKKKMLRFGAPPPLRREFENGRNECVLTRVAVDPCNTSAANRLSPIFVLPVKVGGYSARLAIDTGATKSDVFQASSAGKSLQSQASQKGEPSVGLSGPSESVVAPAQALEVGECHFQKDLDLVEGMPGRTCQRDGALGIDVLHECRLLFEGRQLRVRCAGNGK